MAGRGKSTKLEFELIYPQDTLTRDQMSSWWKWDKGWVPFLNMARRL